MEEWTFYNGVREIERSGRLHDMQRIANAHGLDLSDWVVFKAVQESLSSRKSLEEILSNLDTGVHH